jgi:hypothetical protein
VDYKHPVRGEYWNSFALSADGKTLVAVAAIADVDLMGAGSIFISTNLGTTWMQANAPVKAWSGVASSADGCHSWGSAYGSIFSPIGSVRSGAIYTAQTPPLPQLNIAPTNGNLMLSWIVPSTNFVLQQNLDLTTANWSDVTNLPALNLSSLENQVIVSPSNSSGFYRLATP